jgi:hypothetical protein
MPRGRGWPVPGRPPVTVRFGRPIVAVDGDEPRELAIRIETAVAALLDEDESTWWEATQRAARGESPSPAGPDVARWRRVWAQTAAPDVRRHRRLWAR